MSYLDIIGFLVVGGFISFIVYRTINSRKGKTYDNIENRPDPPPNVRPEDMMDQ